MVAMEKVARLRYEQFNTAGQAPKIKTSSLERWLLIESGALKEIETSIPCKLSEDLVGFNAKWHQEKFNGLKNILLNKA